MTVHQHTREGNSITPVKLCSLKNGLITIAAEVCGETYSKKIIKIWSRKTAIDVKILSKVKVNGKRRREVTYSDIKELKFKFLLISAVFLERYFLWIERFFYQ